MKIALSNESEDTRTEEPSWWWWNVLIKTASKVSCHRTALIIYDNQTKFVQLLNLVSR